MEEIKLKQYISSQERLKIGISNPEARKVYIETYGCQMNVADSELVTSVMLDAGFAVVEDYNIADIVFMNTCSVRDNAEQRIRNRLNIFKFLKKSRPNLIIGILGCMAERLREKLVEDEKLIDIVAGPDSYRSLPILVKEASNGEFAINVLLSREETYADISPVRMDKNHVTAYISITRGCDNMCAFCVVPFTRGRERSRNPETILKEVNEILVEGYKEVTLLGQNVDKYNWNNGEVSFSKLLIMVAQTTPNLRVRFATSYPQDFTDEVLYAMAAHENICNYIHLPVQHGSTRILEKMKRGYTREWYLERVAAMRRIVPDCSISTDIISGFCSETLEDHQATLSLMKEVGFDYAYMFNYSVRPNTFAERNYEDDVPEDEKGRRLTEIISLQNKLSLESNKKDVNKTFRVLIEGVSKKSDDRLYGRTSHNKVVVFPKRSSEIGDYVDVLITECTSATLLGHITKDQSMINKYK